MTRTLRACWRNRFGAGGEARRPLGLIVEGGLSISQLLTLYITPVDFVYLESLRRWAGYGPAVRRRDPSSRSPRTRARRKDGPPLAPYSEEVIMTGSDKMTPTRQRKSVSDVLFVVLSLALWVVFVSMLLWRL